MLSSFGDALITMSLGLAIIATIARMKKTMSKRMATCAQVISGMGSVSCHDQPHVQPYTGLRYVKQMFNVGRSRENLQTLLGGNVL